MIPSIKVSTPSTKNLLTATISNPQLSKINYTVYPVIRSQNPFFCYRFGKWMQNKCKYPILALTFVILLTIKIFQTVKFFILKCLLNKMRMSVALDPLTIELTSINKHILDIHAKEKELEKEEEKLRQMVRDVSKNSSIQGLKDTHKAIKVYKKSHSELLDKFNSWKNCVTSFDKFLETRKKETVQDKNTLRETIKSYRVLKKSKLDDDETPRMRRKALSDISEKIHSLQSKNTATVRIQPKYKKFKREFASDLKKTVKPEVNYLSQLQAKSTAINKTLNNQIKAVQEKQISQLKQFSIDIRNNKKSVSSKEDLKAYISYLDFFKEHYCFDPEILSSERIKSHEQIKKLANEIFLPKAETFQFVNGNLLGKQEIQNTCWLDSTLEILTPIFSNHSFELQRPQTPDQKNKKLLFELQRLFQTAHYAKFTGDQEAINLARSNVEAFLYQHSHFAESEFAETGFYQKNRGLQHDPAALLTSAMRTLNIEVVRCNSKDRSKKKENVITCSFSGAEKPITFESLLNRNLENSCILLNGNQTAPAYITIGFKRREYYQQAAPINRKEKFDEIKKEIGDDVAEFLKPIYGLKIAIGHYFSQLPDNSFIFGKHIRDLLEDDRGGAFSQLVLFVLFDDDGKPFEDSKDHSILKGNLKTEFLDVTKIQRTQKILGVDPASKLGSERLQNVFDFIVNHRDEIIAYAISHEERLRLKYLSRSAVEWAATIIKKMGPDPCKPLTLVYKRNDEILFPENLFVKLDIFGKETATGIEKTPAQKYEIVSFQTHVGKLADGHFEAYRKGIHDAWFHCNNLLKDKEGKGITQLVSTQAKIQEVLKKSYCIVLKRM